MELIRDKRVKDAMMNSTIQKMFQRGELRKDHPLQRKPGRWNNGDRDGLVATVLKNEDIDSIKICEQLTENGVILWVIDGLQRLTTLNSYYNEGFKLGNGVEFPVVTYQATVRDEDGNVIKDEYGNYAYELVECDLRGKFFSDLPVELQERFGNFKIDMVKHLNCTDEEIGYHIRRYNKQKSMNGAENAVTYMDNAAREVKRVTLNNRFFKNDVYSQMERNNGTIERIVMESVMCMFHLDEWKKQSRKMGEFLNRHSGRQEFERLNDNLNRLEAACGDEIAAVFTSRDSFLWFTLFDRFTAWGVEDRRFAEFAVCFCKGRMAEEKINGESFDQVARNRSTKDKFVVEKKLEILEGLLREFLKLGCTGKGGADGDEPAAFIAEMLQLDAAEIREDMDFYRESLDDLTTRTIKDGSALLAEENRLSLLAMVVYSYRKDVDLDEWLGGYAKTHPSYLADQKRNFLHMKRDFEKSRQQPFGRTKWSSRHRGEISSRQNGETA